MEHLSKNDDGKKLCPVKVFTGLKPSALLVQLSPSRRFRRLNCINEERCNQLININLNHEGPAQMQKSM